MNNGQRTYSAKQAVDILKESAAFNVSRDLVHAADAAKCRLKVKNCCFHSDKIIREDIIMHQIRQPEHYYGKESTVMKGVSRSLYYSSNTGAGAGTSFTGVTVSTKESSPSYRESRKGKVKIRVNFSAAGAMVKLAQAQTKTQAASIERSFQARLQEAKRFDCDDATLRAIQKAVGRAGHKR